MPTSEITHNQLIRYRAASILRYSLSASGGGSPGGIEPATQRITPFPDSPVSIAQTRADVNNQ
jgi:hypothetical protein